MPDLDTAPAATVATPPDRAPSEITGPSVRPGDRLFRTTALVAGSLVLLVMAGIAGFLVYKAIPALQKDKTNFFTTQVWQPDALKPTFGIAALLMHTIITGLLAMVIAVPVAIGIALFINFYAHRRLAGALGYIVDLLAAVPSIVYGLFGITLLAPHLHGLVRWLSKYFGWTGFLHYRPDNIPNSHSDLTGGIVLAIMILPIISSLSREVFRQTPTDHIEASLALGATRWEMIRTAVLPYGRSGVVSASILGLGRAFGETMAVAYILSSTTDLNFHITETGGITFASNIANKYNEATPLGINALVASGLCLFVITLVVNLVAQSIVRRKSGVEE
ncbi:MAG TPA: phosphate ABC transporter permease subunit PstC [Mycobacteriales bacterium]|nr:phosphate ABC transporter permease subunit PstC [Mycobacteriales bacterium]